MRSFTSTTVLILIICPIICSIWGCQVEQKQTPVEYAYVEAKEPITAEWIQEHLRQGHPRLVLTAEREEKLSSQYQSEAWVKSYVSLLQDHARDILDTALVERALEGRRLLGVSRESLRRMTNLAILQRIEPNPAYVDRISEELTEMIAFSDWNPSHFLDVAEMALAVSIAIDWVGEYLTPELVSQARQALIDKAINPSFQSEYDGWVDDEHNWNQVCHGGLSAAALTIGDEHPELAAKVIQRAIDHLPLAMNAYAPDGAYPEGTSYWAYGTSYNIVAIDMYETALGTSFGLSNAPGFLNSVTFRLMSVGPTGLAFNYSDCKASGKLDDTDLGLISWITQRDPAQNYFESAEIRENVIEAVEEGGYSSRLSAMSLIWLLDHPALNVRSLPEIYVADGINPIAIIRTPEEEGSGLYIGIKGGKASNNHGDMDAGSFILEMDSVRWGIDLGRQNYHELEQVIGLGLWDKKPGGTRWTLLAKNNEGHSTLTVNNMPHQVDGFASVSALRAEEGDARIEVNLQEVLQGPIQLAKRRFQLLGQKRFMLEDEMGWEEELRELRWAFITTADVKTNGKQAILMQDGQYLQLKVHKPVNAQFTVTSLNPPPLEYDIKVPNLKRIEIKLSPDQLRESQGMLQVEFDGNVGE